jgi:serine/threonine protein kinase
LEEPTFVLKNEAVVGQWVIYGEKPIGYGGQAEVWRARHLSESHAPWVAIKLCRDDSPKAHARFAREVELLQKYTNPGIVKLRDHGFHDGQPFFATELATTNFDRLASADTAGMLVLRESPGLLLEFFRDACSGVAHLHANGVLHRDLKPENILVFLDPKEGMRTVVADLGISCLADAQGNLTHTQEIVGTPAYRAPECAGGEHYRSSDVYSLGKTLEFLFTRKRPPRHGPGKCARDLRMAESLWDLIDGVLERACALKQEHRYRDAGELLAALPKVVLSPVAVTPTQPLTRMIAEERDLEVALDSNEIAILAAVIGKCPVPGHSVRQVTLERSISLSSYNYSMAMRRLLRVGFLELVSWSDDEGNTWDQVGLTSRGEDWAFNHPKEMAPPEPPARDDEIPF